MDVGNDVLSVGNNILGVCDVVTNVRNGYMCIYCKFSLEKRAVSNGGENVTERTLKT